MNTIAQSVILNRTHKANFTFCMLLANCFLEHANPAVLNRTLIAGSNIAIPLNTNEYENMYVQIFTVVVDVARAKGPCLSSNCMQKEAAINAYYS